MPIVCPHCSHAMKPEGPPRRAVQPEMRRSCGRTFRLVVTLEPGPSFRTSKLSPRRLLRRPTPADDARRDRRPGRCTPTATPISRSAASIVRSKADNGDTSHDRTPSRPLPPTASAPRSRTSPPPRRARVTARDALSGTLGGYRIEKELGRGGMGAVYLARQVSLDRPVALKVMNSRWASNPNFLVRFTREAYAAAQLRPPQRRPGLRHRRRAGHQLLQHGVRRGPVARRPAQEGGAARPRGRRRATSSRRRAG